MNLIEDEGIYKARKPSLIGAGCVSLMLAFNNPSGHQALHDATVMAYFTPSWMAAMKMVNRPMSFDEFRQGASVFQMVYHNNDSDKMLADIKMLFSQSPLCIPFGPSDDQDDKPTNPPVMPCHVAGLREKKKGLDHKPKVS